MTSQFPGAAGVALGMLKSRLFPTTGALQNKVHSDLTPSVDLVCKSLDVF